MQLVLFDVDDTLIRGSPAHREAFRRAFTDIYATEADIFEISPYGKTDPQILIEVLAKRGISMNDIEAKLPEALDLMEDVFDSEVEDSEIIVLDGVMELLKILKREKVLTGVVSGNLASIAWEKLERAQLKPFLYFGTFGSDDADRATLVNLAVQRARDFGFTGADVTIIGDSPNDIIAGRAAGVRTLGVASGEYSFIDLHEVHADEVVESMVELPAILEFLGIKK